MISEKNAAVIMICKSHVSEAARTKMEDNALDTVGAIIHYLSSWSGTPLCYIEVDQVRIALTDALIDSINHSDNPGNIIVRLFDLMDHGYDRVHAMISTLRMLKVRTSPVDYINGFCQANTAPANF